MITETEAYCGVEDRASHAYNNCCTKRMETMYSKGEWRMLIYVDGLHHLLNIVTK